MKKSIICNNLAPVGGQYKVLTFFPSSKLENSNIIRIPLCAGTHITFWTQMHIFLGGKYT